MPIASVRDVDAGVESKNGQPILTIPDAAAWEQWLAANHTGHPGVWLKLAKKGAPSATVSYADALDVALCYGWIDGQKGAYDGEYWLQRFTARGPRSVWSQVNRDKVASLIEAGRMRPAGQGAVDKAMADGRWAAAYAPQSKATVPPDLQAALEANPAAATAWATWNSTNRYAVLYRVHNAKRPETRARRIAQFVDMLIRDEKLYP